MAGTAVTTTVAGNTTTTKAASNTTTAAASNTTTAAAGSTTAAPVVVAIKVAILAPLNFTQHVCVALGNGSCVEGTKKCQAAFAADANSALGCTGCVSDVSCVEGSVKIGFTVTPAATTVGSTPNVQQSPTQLLTTLKQKMTDSSSPLGQGVLAAVVSAGASSVTYETVTAAPTTAAPVSSAQCVSAVTVFGAAAVLAGLLA